MKNQSTPLSLKEIFTACKVIVVAQSKGGSGKSMTACNIAIDAANQGLNVLLVDAEEDGTTIDFQEPRADLSNLTIMNGYDSAFPTMLNVYRKGYDLIVIDTAGVNADMDSDSRDNKQALINKKIMAQSDFILIPVVPTPVDIRKAQRFIPSIETYVEASMGQRKALIFLNKTDDRERHTREAKELLGGLYSIPLSQNTIRDTAVFEHAEGEFKSITEYAKSSDGAKDMQALQQEIYQILSI